MLHPNDLSRRLTDLAGQIRDIRYFERFVRLTCAPDILELGVFPNAKEITESMAAFNAIQEHCPFPFDDAAVCCLVIADGSTPRTGALIAMRTRWQVVSVDPALSDGKIPTWQAKVQRLTCLKERLEDLPQTLVDRAVIVAVHAHNGPGNGRGCPSLLDVAVHKVLARDYTIIALPCCHRLPLGDLTPTAEYKDPGVWSPFNRVHVWRLPRGAP